MPRWPDVSVADRFWSKVDKTGNCWIWTASYGSTGYGQFMYNYKPIKAHRMAYILVNGEINNGLHILHNCDNPSCVNPEHLRAGTHAENMNDMALRDRTNNKGRAYKLSDEQIRLIRGSTKSALELATEFGVSRRYIYDILKNKFRQLTD